MQAAIFALLFVTAQAIANLSLQKQKWDMYKLTFGKMYNDRTEENRRFDIFSENMDAIEEHNELFERGLKTYSLRENQFTDLTHEEYLETVLQHSKQGRNIEVAEEDSYPEDCDDDDDDSFPEYVNYIWSGLVTPVKNQLKCKASWSFSAVGAFEGQFANKYGQLLSFSEQNLIDCSAENNGCQGGDIIAAYGYMRRNGTTFTGIYPYVGKEGTCVALPDHTKFKIKDYVTLKRGSEKELKRALVTVGPISVSIDASHRNFRHYYNGIFNEQSCGNFFGKLNHNALVVGYDTDNNENDYWIVKNSWGRSFGQRGFIFMSRNKNNQCGIATRATYPLLHDKFQ